MAFRLILEAAGGEYRLVRKQRVAMDIPALATLDAPTEGVYAEVRNAGGEPIYRQSLSTQVELPMEVFSADQSISRVEVPGATRTIVLLVPDDPHARSLVVLRAPSGGAGRLRSQSSGPEELATFSLTDDAE